MRINITNKQGQTDIFFLTAKKNNCHTNKLNNFLI